MSGDLLVTCTDCGQEFTLTSKDQEFFQLRGYSIPKRCTPCRQSKKNEQSATRGYQTNGTQGTTVTCSDCGKQTTVPFEPRGDRPVLLPGLLPEQKEKRGRPGASEEVPLTARATALGFDSVASGAAPNILPAL